MEHLNNSLANATNNNVVDNLEALKDSQSKVLETAEQLNDLIEKQPDQTEKQPDQTNGDAKNEVNLVDLNDDPKSSVDDANKVDDQVNELVSELTSQADDQQQVNELVNELTSQTDRATEEKPASDDLINNDSSINNADLTESTRQLFDDLNDTNNTNTLDSSKVLNSSNLENLTAENFLEHSIPSNHQGVIEDLLDCSVKEIQSDNVLDFTQAISLDDSNKENAADADKPSENLLEQLGLNQDDSKDAARLETEVSINEKEALQCVTLVDDSKEISLIEISSDDIKVDEPVKPAEPALQSDLLDQPIKEEAKDSEILAASVIEETADSTSAAKSDGFFNELNKELHATADELNNMMSHIAIRDEQANEQPQVEQETLEDHVTKADEIEPAQTKNESQTPDDQLAKSKTFVIRKSVESAEKNEIEQVQNKEQATSEQQATNEPTNEPTTESKETSQPAGEQPKEGSWVDLDKAEPVAPLPISPKRDSRASEVLTESQEILKNADRLIESKRNSINQDIRIPGLEISQSTEQESSKPESSTAAEQPATTEVTTSEAEPSAATESPANESTSSKSSKHGSLMKKCVIS